MTCTTDQLLLLNNNTISNLRLTRGYVKMIDLVDKINKCRINHLSILELELYDLDFMEDIEVANISMRIWFHQYHKLKFNSNIKFVDLHLDANSLELTDILLNLNRYKTNTYPNIDFEFNITIYPSELNGLQQIIDLLKLDHIKSINVEILQSEYKQSKFFDILMLIDDMMLSNKCNITFDDDILYSYCKKYNTLLNILTN